MNHKRELSRSERRDIRTLVTTMCANYSKEYDCCPLLNDYGCYMLTKQLSDNKLCKYFREAVLPLNPILEVSLTCKSADTKQCAICSKLFIPTGRQVYCSEKCELEGKRKKDREWRRKYKGKES